MPNLKLKTLYFGKKSRKKIEILSIHNLLCRKFAAVCLKIATPCPPTFLNHVAGHISMLQIFFKFLGVGIANPQLVMSGLQPS